MDIRQAQEQDIPAIVSLLKMSLGEELLPKSEEYWRWKHVDNPFGKSPVLLAFENETLVGVRAFMQWQWREGDHVYRAVRAVDTATHPEHQGKGIFKKLTLMLLDNSKHDGIDFVFNTPNQNSKPGYLKMGWVEAGKLPVSLRIRRPLSMLKCAAGFTSYYSQPFPPADQDILANSAAVDALLKRARVNNPTLVTNHTAASLLWRYKSVKVVSYLTAGIESAGRLVALVIYRIKAGRLGLEFRVTDVFLESQQYRNDAIAMVQAKAKQHHAAYISVGSDHKWIAEGFLSVHALKVGPIVTVRDVTDAPMKKLKEFESWSPSLGDLELF